MHAILILVLRTSDTYTPLTRGLQGDPGYASSAERAVPKARTDTLLCTFSREPNSHSPSTLSSRDRLAIKHYGSRERADGKTLDELKQELAWPMPTIGLLEGEVLKLGDDTSLSAVPAIAGVDKVCYAVTQTYDIEQTQGGVTHAQTHPHIAVVNAETVPSDGQILFKIVQKDAEPSVSLQASKDDLSSLTVDELVRTCAAHLGQNANGLGLVIGRRLRLTETSRSVVHYHWVPSDEELNTAMIRNTKKCMDARFLTMTQRMLRWAGEHALFAKLQEMTHDAYGASGDHGAERRSTQPAARYRRTVDLLKARHARDTSGEYVLCILTLGIIAADTSEPNLEMLLDAVIKAEEAKRPLLPLRRTTAEGKLDVEKSAAAVRAMFDVLQSSWRQRQNSTPDSRALDPCSDISTPKQVVDRLSHRSRRKQPREAARLHGHKPARLPTTHTS